MKLEQEPSLQRVITDLEEALNIKKWGEAVFCGFGEPTERLDCLLEVAKWLRQRYGKSLAIRVNTNGQGCILNPQRQVTRELKAAGVDKLSISLNAQNEKVYNEVCRPKMENAYAAVLAFINSAKEELETEITAVTIPEIDILEVEKIAKAMGVKFRIRPYIQGFW